MLYNRRCLWKEIEKHYRWISACGEEWENGMDGAEPVRKDRRALSLLLCL